MSDQQRRAKWLLTGARGGSAAFVVHVLGALAVTFGAWRGPTTGWAGVFCDQEQAIWCPGWTPHALANGLNPFFTTRSGAPAGVNLMWKTTVPLLGLADSLPTAIGGPLSGFNALTVAGIALSGFTARLAIRRWTGDGLGPLVGGAVAVIVAVVIAKARRMAAPSEAKWLTAMVLSLVLLIPAPLPRASFRTPAFLRHRTDHHIAAGETVLVAPYFVNGGEAANDLFGRAPDIVDEVALWRDIHVRGVVARSARG